MPQLVPEDACPAPWEVTLALSDTETRTLEGHTWRAHLGTQSRHSRATALPTIWGEAKRLELKWLFWKIKSRPCQSRSPAVRIPPCDCHRGNTARADWLLEESKHPGTQAQSLEETAACLACNQRATRGGVGGGLAYQKAFTHFSLLDEYMHF